MKYHRLYLYLLFRALGMAAAGTRHGYIYRRNDENEIYLSDI